MSDGFAPVAAKRIDLEKLATKTTAFFAKNPELQKMRTGLRALSLADLQAVRP